MIKIERFLKEDFSNDEEMVETWKVPSVRLGFYQRTRSGGEFLGDKRFKEMKLAFPSWRDEMV